MSQQVYQLIHLTGVFLVLFALGGIVLHMINGGTREYSFRRTAAITHGVGMFLALLGGFGLLAKKLHIGFPFPGWVWGKLIIWLCFGLLLAVIYRKPGFAKGFWWIIPGLAIVAIILVTYKPF